MRKLLFIIVLFLVAIGLGTISGADDTFSLNIVRAGNGKLIFTLNGSSFLPVVISCDLNTKEDQIRKFKSDGFNIIYTAIDFPWIYSRDKEIKNFLNVCNKLEMPVIVELASWDYWNNFLSINISCNMRMSTGEYVRNYPDFLNPMAKEEYLKRFRKILEFLKLYYHKPIIAISIGTYDAYHIPDGETHADFVVPEHTKIAQTWLPYGEHILKDFKSFLIKRGISLKDLGFSEWLDIYLPTDKENAKNENHWREWMYYRREGYTLTWIKDIVELAKESAGLPVTMTLDLRPDIWEDWGTPGLSIARIIDFIIVYYYGTGPPEFRVIPRRLERISTEYNHLSVPLISLLEFSSALGGTRAEDYIFQSYPYVSGFQFGFFDGRGQGEVRYEAFVKAISQVKRERLWEIEDEKAILAILLSKEDVYISEDVSGILHREKIPYDIIYDVDLLPNYKVIFIPGGQSFLEGNLQVKKKIEEFILSGGIVIEESKGNSLYQYLNEIHRIMKEGG